MAHPSLDKVMRHVRNLAAGQNAMDQRDGELLRAFSAEGDQAAFAALAKRHGPLVLAVCRRVLGQLQDAEDAFQATFVVLARNAARLVQKGSLSSWLHGVAYRIALNARRLSARRRWHERQAKTMVSTNPAWEAGWREVQLLLDEEVQRLPEKYREPFILCCLEHQSCAAAARRMGLKEGTVWSRLAEARKRLQKRLSRRGVELTAVLGAAALAPNPVIAAALVTKAVSAATAPALPASGAVAVLVKGMTRALFLGKAKLVVAMFLAVSGIVGVTGMAAHQLSPTERTGFQGKNSGVPSVAKEKASGPERKDPSTAMDQYGDSLPQGALLRMGTVRLRHNGAVIGVTFSSDGKMLASAAMDEAIRLWDRSTGKPIAVLSNSGRDPTVCIAFSPDGTKLASGGFRGNVRLWDVQTGKLIWERKSLGGRVEGIAFAPDGRSFASAGGNVQVWSAATGAEILNLGAADAGSNVVAFSPDGKLLAASRREDIHVWDARTGAWRLVIPAHAARVESVVFSDNSTLISSGEGQIRFWDAATGKKLRELKSETSYVDSLTLSADGKHLGAAFEDKIRIWDMRTMRVHSDYPNALSRSSFQNHLAFSPDAKTLAAQGADSVIRLWDVSTGKRVLDFSDSHSGRVLSVAFSPDGRQVLTSGQEGTVRLWDAGTAKQLRLYQGESKLRSWTVAALSPDGKKIAAGGYDSDNNHLAGSCRVWDAATGKELRMLGLPHRVRVLAFTQDGEKVAIAGGGGAYERGGRGMYVWDFSTDKELVKLPEHDGEVVGLAFSPDGRTLASVGTKSLGLWDMATKKQRAKFALPENTFAAAFSADGKIVVTSKAFDEMLFVREIATGQILGTIKVKDTLGSAMALSPDGRILASSQVARTLTSDNYDVAIHLWEMATGREVLRFQPGRSVGASLTFSADGRTLISGMENGTALIWNVKTRPVKTLPPQDLERLWQDLAGEDAAKAYAAICTLGGVPEASVPFLRSRLLSLPDINIGRVRTLIDDLGSDRFSARQAASKELEKLGDKVTALLRQALANNPSLELRRRLESLLKTAGELRPGVNVRRLRAIQVLEDIGSQGALQTLETLAQLSPATGESEEARSSLERVGKRLKR